MSDATDINCINAMFKTLCRIDIFSLRCSTGDAPCDEYRGTCDVISGFRCVRFDDVTERRNDAGEVQCVCMLGVDVCRPTDTQHEAGPTSSLVSDVISDVTSDEDVGDNSHWLLIRRHTDRLIGRS